MLKAILFDLDGVLINSSSVIVKNFKKAIKDSRYPEPTDKDIIDLFGLKISIMLRTILFKALKTLNIQNAEAIYIGDTESDVGAAKNAKVPCVIISSTGNSLGADYVIKKISELPTLVNRV
jgi:phosphoglycolate phosphatase-like HAD superfamily hydrolase